MGIKALELVLVLGAVLGIGIWQLLDVNKALKEDREREGHPSPSSSDATPERKTGAGESEPGA